MRPRGTRGRRRRQRAVRRPRPARRGRTAWAGTRRRRARSPRTAVSSVFCALMTMMRRSGRSLRMRGMRSRPFSSGITTSVMTRSPSPSCDPLPQRRGVAGAAHVVALSRPSAWCRTVRIARSSSATRMVVPARHACATCLRGLQRQQHPEDGAAGLAVELDRAAVVADDLGDQCKTEASAGRLGGDEGVEQVGADLVGTPRPLSRTDTTSGRFTRACWPGHREPQAVPVGGRQLDLALAVARHLGGVLHQVEEDLDRAGRDRRTRRQRRVVALDEAHVLAEAVGRQAAHVVRAPGGC